MADKFALTPEQIDLLNRYYYARMEARRLDKEYGEARSRENNLLGQVKRALPHLPLSDD